MKKKSLFIILISLILVCSFFVSVQAQNTNPKVLKGISVLTADKKFRTLVNAYIDGVVEASNGQLLIEIVADASSVPSDQQLFALRDGVVDIAFDLECLSSISPVYSTQMLTGMYPWEEREKGLYDLWRKTYIEDANLYWLGRSTGVQWFVIGLKKEVKSLEELSNLKIRTISPNAPAIEALGAVPIIIPFGDIIPAMQRGLVDGFLMTTEDWVENGYPEVTPYVLNIRFLEGAQTGILVNMDLWNSLSEQQKNWLQEPLIKNERLYYALSYWNYAAGEYKIAKSGVTMINWSPEETEKALILAKKAIWDSITPKLKPEYIDLYTNIVTYLK